MEQIADPGTIRLTADTLHLAEGFVQVQPLGATPVKGLATPVEVFELAGASPVRSRLQSAAARGLTTFVGRTGEMDTLFAGLERARTGRGQVLAIVGEPGVGKSRLVWEFTHSRRTRGCLVLEALSVSYGKATTYLPVIDLLKTYCAIDPRDDARKIREKVTGKLLTLDQALMLVVPPILSLLDVPPDDTWRRLDPLEQRRQILDGLRALFLRESQEQPLVLVFEDLHWIDGETQALLDRLVESLPTARILLLVNYRPKYHHAWGSKTYYTQVRLDALPPASATELLHTILGPDPSVGALALLLIARTEGNPFFLEESVQSLVETGALAGERGAYRLVQAPQTLQLPATAQTILAARIDRLRPEDKRLLQTAAVIGKHVPYPLLQAIAEVDEPALQAGLGRLQEGEFLYEVQLFPEVEYTFKHALTHEVAYGGLLHERRRELHQRVVAAIESLHAERLADQVERLAHHAFCGERWDRAARYARQAGTKATLRWAYQSARPVLEQAIAALQRLPETRETLAEIADVRLQLRTVLFYLGDHHAIRAQLEEAERLARHLGDEQRQASAANWLSATFLMAGDLPEAHRWAETNLALATRIADAPLRAMAFYNVGRAALIEGDYPRALEALRSVAEPPADFAAFTRSWLTWTLAELGDFDQALAEGRRGMEIATTPLGASQTAAWLGRTLTLRGDLMAGIALLEQALAVAQQHELAFPEHLARVLLGYATALHGDAQGGPRLFEAGMKGLDASGFKALGFMRSHHAEVLLLARRREEAAAVAEQAHREARDMGARPGAAWALRVLGDVAAAAESPDAARADGRYRAALALAAELGMRPLVAHCHVGLAKLYRRTGERVQADEHLTTATTMYREMGMTYWLEKAEAKMRGVA